MPDTETLLSGMAVHGIEPMVGNRARRGDVIMHGRSITEACEELLGQCEGVLTCGVNGHVAPLTCFEPVAFICTVCGASVSGEETNQT